MAVMQEINPAMSKTLTILFGVVLLLPVAYVFASMIIADWSRETRVREALSMLPKQEGQDEAPGSTITMIQITDHVSPFPILRSWFSLSPRLWIGVTGLICSLVALTLWICSAVNTSALARTSTYDPTHASQSWAPDKPND